MRWSFAKYAGCGNDFILFDNRQKDFPLERVLISKLCERRSGIGADGILLWEESNVAQAKMRIFNADGSEAEMCGNGLRCFVKWLASKNSDYSSCLIEVHQRLLAASHVEQGVRIELGVPSNLQWNVPFNYEDKQLILHHVDTGVPHTLLFVENVRAIDVHSVGSYIRHAWKPKGTNVTFVHQTAPQAFKIRTYERGVEAETPACGTGAAAAALAAAHLYQCASPIIIETASNDKLLVDFHNGKDGFCQAALTGPADYLFHGEIDLPK